MVFKLLPPFAQMINFGHDLLKQLSIFRVLVIVVFLIVVKVIIGWIVDNVFDFYMMLVEEPIDGTRTDANLDEFRPVVLCDFC